MLSHIWTSEDTWPAATCRDFIMEWSAVLDKRTQVVTIFSSQLIDLAVALFTVLNVAAQ